MSDRIAVYGTLQHGSAAWHLLEPLVTGPSERVELPGTLYDTGRGYPALRLDGGGRVPAQVFRLRDPTRAWPLLDHYEGPDYERHLITVAGGSCWVYSWPGPTTGFRPLPRGWPPA
ncbi:gamma-glutamylcyclotransferase family protein [Saccharopolyspora rhizosphaerae]|uniref:gamma-glutamylcyclotransferase family protein n=1 Tax=Saccharopolyspora rhizosphaerae TaxID=2492662 RepID=UPI0013151B9A|nr:gamma-glutamylcyclotransferase family protein [Saccharopolyspora rhizosphaerae]